MFGGAAVQQFTRAEQGVCAGGEAHQEDPLVRLHPTFRARSTRRTGERMSQSWLEPVAYMVIWSSHPYPIPPLLELDAPKCVVLPSSPRALAAALLTLYTRLWRRSGEARRETKEFAELVKAKYHTDR